MAKATIALLNERRMQRMPPEAAEHILLTCLGTHGIMTQVA